MTIGAESPRTAPLYVYPLGVIIIAPLSLPNCSSLEKNYMISLDADDILIFVVLSTVHLTQCHAYCRQAVYSF